MAMPPKSIPVTPIQLSYHSRGLAMNPSQTETVKAITKAIPPNLGIGYEWIFRGPGLSVMPRLSQNNFIGGINRYVRYAERSDTKTYAGIRQFNLHSLF